MRKNLYIVLYEFKVTKRPPYSEQAYLPPGLVDKVQLQGFEGDVQLRCRELLVQVCDAEEIEILKGVISSDRVHMHVGYAPKQNVGTMVKLLKGRSSRKLQTEFPRLKDRYWGRHFLASGYGVWSSGNITDRMVDDYLEHHRKPNGPDKSNFILE